MAKPVLSPRRHVGMAKFHRRLGPRPFRPTVFNSVFITVVKVPLGLVISAMAAYSLSAHPTVRRPGDLSPRPVRDHDPVSGDARADLHARQSPRPRRPLSGIILPYLAFGVPYQVFILYAFFREVPRELGRSCANRRGLSLRHLPPHLAASFAAGARGALLILDFVATWNEFAMALVILQDNRMWTLPLGLMSFQSQFSSDYGQLNAAIVMTVLPATIVYLIFQRCFVSGLTTARSRSRGKGAGNDKNDRKMGRPRS